MSDWLILSDNGVKRFKKEILRTGQFRKQADGIEFEIDKKFLDHLSTTFSEMKTDGVKVPVPMGHKESDDNNKGWLHGLEREGEHLYGVFEVNGVSDEDLKNYDVSAFIPPTYAAGNGKEYQRPIRHVALTAYPVIPGLDRFEAIAASLIPMEKESPMPIDFVKLGTDLGITEEMSEETAPALLLSAFEALTAQLTEAKRPVKSNLEELQELGKAHPGLIKFGKSGREAKIDALMLSDKPKINKVVRDKLVALFCSDESIALSLDESETDFDRIITILAENELAPTGEQTGPQSLILSDPGKAPVDGLLVAEAKSRKQD